MMTNQETAKALQKMALEVSSGKILETWEKILTFNGLPLL
jgi:hypothetical protein